MKGGFLFIVVIVLELLSVVLKGKLYDAVHEALDNGGKFYASIYSVDWGRRENDPKKCIEISVNFTE